MSSHHNHSFSDRSDDPPPPLQQQQAPSESAVQQQQPNPQVASEEELASVVTAAPTASIAAALGTNDASNATDANTSTSPTDTLSSAPATTNRQEQQQEEQQQQQQQQQQQKQPPNYCSQHHYFLSGMLAGSGAAGVGGSTFVTEHQHRVVKQQVERCSRWLSSIPTDEALAMQHTREYRDFMKAFDSLEQAHRHVLQINQHHHHHHQHQQQQQQQHDTQQSSQQAAAATADPSSCANDLSETAASNQNNEDNHNNSLDFSESTENVDNYHDDDDADYSDTDSNANNRMDLDESTLTAEELRQQQSLRRRRRRQQKQQQAFDSSGIPFAGGAGGGECSTLSTASIPTHYDAGATRPTTTTKMMMLSFLQHMAADDVILRVFEFLECHSLIRATLTCCRFRDLAHRSARQRTYKIAQERQLSNVMQLLRAKEQIDGTTAFVVPPTGGANFDPAVALHDACHVRVPTLLLSRRVLVTNCGDPEFNGVFYCTGSNGNGFVFTKPRYPEQRVVRSEQANRMILSDEVFLDSRLESEVTQPGQLLRCIIAKRFSNETILWYLSKEVVATENNGEVQVGDITQIFSFWAKLMVIGDASPDICRYPSQSSILARHDEAWQTLSTTRTTEPPVVELLD